MKDFRSMKEYEREDRAKQKEIEDAIYADALAWRSFSEWLDGQDNMTQYGCNFISMLELKRLHKTWREGSHAK
jgi:hypothetical protein